MEDVFAEYAKQVKQGTQVNIQKVGYSDPRFKLYNNLQADAARFAAFREAQKQRDLKAASTADEKAAVEKRYKEYLKTEKQTIFAHSAAAERWTGFQENADIYPNLEYRTAGDSEVRPAHAKLDGIVLPISDPFWRSHTPPLGWGCRCELIQTDAPANKHQDKYKGYELTPAPNGFDFNPGVDQKLFSDSAGYYTSTSKTEAKQLDQQAASFAGKLSRNSVRDAIIGNGETVKPKGLKEVSISNTDIKHITGKPHDNMPMRNALLYDIAKVVKEAKLVKKVKETKGRKQFANWYYYQVKGFDNMFLNFVEMSSGRLKLHAITDKIK